MKPEAKVGLARSTLFHILGGRRKDIQDLDRNLRQVVNHLPGQRDLSICLEPSEEISNAFEYIDKNIFALDIVFSRLTELNSSRALSSRPWRK